MTTLSPDQQAWLGDAAETLTDEQAGQFVTGWDYVAANWPDTDDQGVRDAALAAVAEYVLGDTTLPDLAVIMHQARAQLQEATAACQAVSALAYHDGVSESEVARQVRVDRARTVRRWLGK